MARPLRIELSGGLYHVTSWGDRREDIYFSDADREAWLVLLGKVCSRFNWVCHAYCLMSNHYPLVIETPEGNLAQGMRQLNGVYTQIVNRARGACVSGAIQGGTGFRRMTFHVGSPFDFVVLSDAVLMVCD